MATNLRSSLLRHFSLPASTSCCLTSSGSLLETPPKPVNAAWLLTCLRSFRYHRPAERLYRLFWSLGLTNTSFDTHSHSSLLPCLAYHGDQSAVVHQDSVSGMAIAVDCAPLGLPLTSMFHRILPPFSPILRHTNQITRLPVQRTGM